MTIHALDKNLLIASVPVQYRDRPEGSESKLNTVSDGIKVLATIFRLYRDYRPLRFFGTIFTALFLFSLLLFLPIFSEYIATGLVPRLPTFVASAFLMIAALLSLVCGFVLETNAANSRKNLEIQMNIIRLLLRDKR